LKFQIEVYDNEIGKVAAMLGRPLLITPLAAIERKATLHLKDKATKPPLALVAPEDGPTRHALVFAQQHAAFSASELQDACPGIISKNSLYSTLTRLVHQGIFERAEEPGRKRLYRLTEVGRNMVEKGLA